MRSCAFVVFASQLLAFALLEPVVNTQTADSSSSASPAPEITQDQASTSDTSTPSEPARQQKAGKKADSTASEKGKWHLRLGTVSVGASYSYFAGPFFYPYGPYGFDPGDFVYGSLWYPMWGSHPYYGPSYFAYNNGRGEVHLTADPKSAEVYIDDGYAGTADKLKNIWLDPGAYDLTVSAKDRTSFHQRLY